MYISVSPKEIAADKLTPTHLSHAATALREEGYVVLENVISHDHLDILHVKMEEDLQTLLTARKLPHNFLRGHLQQDPPPFAPYVFRDIVSNPLVIQVSKEVLGAGLYNSFYSGNTNMPGTKAQPVHVDTGQLWSGLKVAHPAASLVINFAPMDVTEENGSIELWPGSHLDTSMSVDSPTIKIPDELLEERRKFAPPIRGNTKKGSMLLRDIRLWHGGTPNESDRPRPMVAMIHNVRWLRRGSKAPFGKGCEDVFADSELEWHIRFTDEPIDYIFRNHAYDYEETTSK